MTAGILSSIPRENLVFVPRRINGQLRPGERVIATEAATQFTLPSPRGSRPIEILNNTGAEVEIAATLGATISGNNVTNGTAFSGVSSVGLPVRGRAVLSADESNWSAVGCTGPLVFSYNGTPLASNAANPLSASDLFHYLGGGSSSFTNPATNGAITVAESSRASGAGGPAVVTDRVANPSTFPLNWQSSNAANSWIAWQFPAAFSPTGLLIQTTVYTNSYHLRSFRIRYSNDLSTGLTAASPVLTWQEGPGWVNQAQITGQGTWHFFPFSSANIGAASQLPPLRRLAIVATGPTSDGANYFTLGEVNWFGAYEG